MSDPTAAATCAACGRPAQPGDRFCEECGQPLAGRAAASTVQVPGRPVAPTGSAPCRECGGVIDADGYCAVCGAKAPNPRDHVVAQPQPWVAAVSDRGLRHVRNEDAAALSADEEPGSRAVLVVCDGVSMSQDSDVASLAAAGAACRVLTSSRSQGLGSDSTAVAAMTTRLVAAADAASAAVTAATTPDHADSPPSCTFVAAVVDRSRVVVGVVGDSRAYWLPDAGPAQVLTVDDSWAAEMVAAGLPRAQAESGPQAHAITRWLGVDAPDHTPTVTHLTVTSPGWLVVCSDGLWNYCSAPDDVAAALRQAAAGAHDEPLATASALVDWANAQGGRDNITVALARLGTDLVAPAGHAQEELTA